MSAVVGVLVLLTGVSSTALAQSQNIDATLSRLTMSGVDFGRFRPYTTSYTADVAYSLTETTVTPELRDSAASYVIKLGGIEDTDGVISLATGSNVITVEVTAEDGQTTQTYTITVTRAATLSTDATLEYLKLSDIDIGSGLNRDAYAQNKTSFTIRRPSRPMSTTASPPRPLLLRPITHSQHTPSSSAA